MVFKMNTLIVFFLMVAGFSFSFGEKNSVENENPDIMSFNVSNDEKKTDFEPEGVEKNLNLFTRQDKPNYLITSDQKIIINQRPQYEKLLDDGSTIPYFGFSNFKNQRQNIYLSDRTGKYNLQLENFQPKKPTSFQAVLGVISARVANQRNNQEYIPYPPNGDPYNYPAYRGHSLTMMDPPAVRAYERATNPNYGVRPVDFEQQDPRRIFFNNDYKSGFSTQFPNPRFSFYKEPDYVNNDGFFTQRRRSSESIYKPLWYNLEENNDELSSDIPNRRI